LQNSKLLFWNLDFDDWNFWEIKVRRIQKVNELIKREVSKILLREVDLPEGVLVTVTRVESSADLKKTKIWISVFPENQMNKINKILNYQIYNIQQKINKLLRMRPIPKIKFVEEKNISQASKIEELLEKIKNE
jgi:ribosome-binding factor A